MMHQVLIMVLAVGAGTGGCPIVCNCRQYPADDPMKNSLYYTSVSCAGYADNVTSGLENTTRDFLVSNLNAEEAEYVLLGLMENVDSLPQLSSLIITQSDIGYVNTTLEDLETIKFLTLTDDHLERLPETFLNLSNLKSLDLSRNEIKVLKLDPFRTLRTLEVLNLSANSLTEIDSGTFGGLTNLRCLDLSGNSLTSLDDQALAPLAYLQYLNLSNNRLEVLNEACFSGLVALQQLDVSWNRLARVAPGTLQLPSLARLLLAGNPRLGGVLVGTGRRLRTVDASRTGLKQVPAALTHSIRTLRLAGNSIRTVRCGDLDSYPLLRLLDFTSNGLESVEEDALGRLECLSVLYLTDNDIREVPRSLPERLKVLHLERNDIRRLSDRDLQGLTGLEVLLLSDNKIGTVDGAAFGQLVSLVTLDLSRNPIGVLGPGCLEGPPALQVLRLSSIGIISPIEEVSFPLSTPEHLITLDLSDSPGLARQLLADTAALAASRELQELDLSRAGLQSIRSDLLHYLPQLRVLHLGGNALDCSGLEWLGAWMRRQNEPEYRDIACAGPPDLWGTPLVDLQDAETSPIETINQPASTVEGKTINQQEENTTNMYQTSSNFTGQYTTESTNYISLETVKNITVLIDDVNSTKRNITNYIENDVANEIVKVNAKKNKTYFANKIDFVNTKKANLNVKITPQIKNEILTTPEDIKREAISTARSATFPVKNDPVSTSRDAIDVRTTTDPTNLDVINTINHDDIKPTNDTDDLIPWENKTSNNNTTDLGPTRAQGEVSIDANMTENSTGETSMYTNNKQESEYPHPGMLILGAAALGAAAALAMLTARFTRRRRRRPNLCQQEDIEVSSLPTVTELW